MTDRNSSPKPTLPERSMQRLLKLVQEKRASHIHFEPAPGGTRVRVRADGVLLDIGPRLARDLVRAIKYAAGMDPEDTERPQDGILRTRWEDDQVVFDVKTAPCSTGERLTLERMTGQLVEPDLDRLGLGLPQLGALRDAILRQSGLILVAGPTGSGKNTTVYGALSRLAAAGRSVATIEWVWWRSLPGVQHAVVDRDAGYDFASALRAYCASGIDVAYTREMEVDQGVLEAAARAVENGMLVFGAIHTLDAPSTLYRLERMGLERWRILQTVTLVVAQRLLRRLCFFCSIEVRHPPAALERLGLRLDGSSGAAIRGPRGCQACAKTGYNGKVLVAETLTMDDSVKEAFLVSRRSQDVKGVLVKKGVPTLRQAALARVLEGATSVEEALQNTPDDGPDGVLACG